MKLLFIRRDLKRNLQNHQRTFKLLFAECERLIFNIYRFRQIGILYLFAEIENVISEIISELFNCYLPNVKNVFSLFTDFANLKFHIYPSRLKM